MTRKLAFAASLVVVVAAVVAVASAATKKHHAASTVKTAVNSTYGTILVNSKGMTLYRLKGETTSHLKCTDKVCLAIWPPDYVKSKNAIKGDSVKHLSVFTQPSSHKLQVAYKSEPLYTFVSDHKAGDANGQNVNGFEVVVVKKKAAAAAPQSSAPSPAPSSGY